MVDVQKIEKKLSMLTDDPGVYLMKDDKGEVIYVGKAKNLKARVSSYFRKNDLSLKTQFLVTKIDDIEVIITDNEVEALILEYNLIKKYRPKFNIRLKDDKSYPYLRVDFKHDYPKIEYTRRTKKDGAKYFGPFISSLYLKETLDLVNKTFGLRVCTDSEFQNRIRPCILYQMKQCLAPCVGLVDKKSYHESLNLALEFLEGKSKKVLEQLRAEMEKQAESENFEFAAVLRDRIIGIEKFLSEQEQKVLDTQNQLDFDVVQLSVLENRAAVCVMMIREGKMVGVNQVPLYDLDLDLKEAEILFEFLIQYYLNIYENSTSLIPSKILVPEILLDYKSDLKNLESALGGRARHSFIFPNTEKEFELLSMLKKTSDQKLVEISSKKVSVLDDLIDVQKKLKLKKLPVRMECYDISHFQGEAKVASRVVFINGVPEKTLYRHYHVKTVEGIDDFKSLEEVLRRRFENDLTKPDFVLIDGGIGQLNKVQAVFEELGVSGVELFSIAKARTSSSFSKKEIVSTDERIFRVNQKNPIILRPNTGAYRILTSLRDEAHRFAIEFHRKVFEDKKIKKP